MSFDDLPVLPPMLNPGADEYAARCMAATRAAQARYRVLIDVRFGDDYWQKLDVYLPQETGGPVPVLVFWHGGAWTNGTKEWMGFMAPPTLAQPAILVAPNYRLAPQARFPAQMDDCIAALDWVWRNIADHGGDRGHIVIGGHSAGGHLAALAALRRDRLTAAGLPPDVVKACLPVSGTYDLRRRDAAPGSFERRPYDVLFEHDEQDEAASPIVHVRPGAPPFFLAWGEHDFPRLLTQVDPMARALEAAGVPCARMELAGCDHFTAHEVCGDAASGWWREAARYLGR